MATAFQIEKSLPVPEPSGRTSKYPFNQMEVGDSFFVPGVAASKLVNAANSNRYRTGYKFTVRTENGGARCWRIA